MTKIKCRILCVDDHLDTSEMLQLLLAEEDYEVRTAGTVEEACSLAEGEEFDLYVIDKRLPDGTGVELCKTLNLLTPGVPCIFYSGDAYAIHRQEALEAGESRYSDRSRSCTTFRKRVCCRNVNSKATIVSVFKSDKLNAHASLTLQSADV